MCIFDKINHCNCHKSKQRRQKAWDDGAAPSVHVYVCECLSVCTLQLKHWTYRPKLAHRLRTIISRMSMKVKVIGQGPQGQNFSTRKSGQGQNMEISKEKKWYSKVKDMHDKSRSKFKAGFKVTDSRSKLLRVTLEFKLWGYSL